MVTQTAYLNKKEHILTKVVQVIGEENAERYFRDCSTPSGGGYRGRPCSESYEIQYIWQVNGRPIIVDIVTMEI